MPAHGPGSTFTDTCGRTQTSPPARRGAVIAERMDSLRPADDLASEPAYLEVKRLRRFTHRSTARTSTRLLSRISCVGCPRNPQVRALIVLADGSCRKNCCGPSADRSGATMIFAELLDTLAYSGRQNFSYTDASRRSPNEFDRYPRSWGVVDSAGAGPFPAVEDLESRSGEIEGNGVFVLLDPAIGECDLEARSASHRGSVA